MTGTMRALGWRWVLIARESAAHWAPPEVRVHSRTACGRPLHGRLLEEPLGGLFGADLRRCAICARWEAK